MDFELTPAQRELRDRAARFVDEECIPHEVAAELNHGPLDPAIVKRIQERARDARLTGGNHETTVRRPGLERV